MDLIHCVVGVQRCWLFCVSDSDVPGNCVAFLPLRVLYDTKSWEKPNRSCTSLFYKLLLVLWFNLLFWVSVKPSKTLSLVSFISCLRTFIFFHSANKSGIKVAYCVIQKRQGLKAKTDNTTSRTLFLVLFVFNVRKTSQKISGNQHCSSQNPVYKAEEKNCTKL